MWGRICTGQRLIARPFWPEETLLGVFGLLASVQHPSDQYRCGEEFMPRNIRVNIYFSDYFEVRPEKLEGYGAFNVSLINDLPLFIDPFLLFNSKNLQYRKLHDEMIQYLRFLRDKSLGGKINDGLLNAWFMFSEVKQTWLGFSRVGNKGSGLGADFARALNKNLNTVFSDFGKERIARASHFEKLCLIDEGVGRDNISDFTTNLIKEFLLNYTQTFSRKHLPEQFRKVVTVEKARFNYTTETWERDSFELPWLNEDYVLLTPANMLTRDETWINRADLINDYYQIAVSIPDEQLREQLNNYLQKSLKPKANDRERKAALAGAYRTFPELLDYYIRYKEDTGDRAEALSQEKVSESKILYIEKVKELVDELSRLTGFYRISGTTYDEARKRVMFLKDIIENKDGYRIFYSKGKPMKREEDIHILYRLTWFGTLSDVNREVNNGRGPVDFAVSRGRADKSLVEFKLASNSQLKRNLQNQVPIYKKASDAQHSLKVIFFFSREEKERVERTLKELKLTGHPDIILVDSRRDNKPSASKATLVE